MKAYMNSLKSVNLLILRRYRKCLRSGHLAGLRFFASSDHELDWLLSICPWPWWGRASDRGASIDWTLDVSRPLFSVAPSKWRCSRCPRCSYW